MSVTHSASVVLGVMAFAPTDITRRVATIHAALDAGITTLDTAPLYEFGESERVVATAVADRRTRVRVWTKVGLRWDGTHGDVLLQTAERTVRKDSRPASVRRDLEDSLARLSLEAVDVAWVHHPDVHTPIEDTMGELLRLRDEGKLLGIGVCNFDAQQVRRAATALGDVALAGVSHGYSLLQRQAETTLWPTLDELGIPFVAYSPLGHGVLTRRGVHPSLSADDFRRYDARFAAVNARRIDAASVRLRQAAARREMSVGRLALAWALRGSGVDAAIVGASRPEQARDSALASAVSLLAAERDALAAPFAAMRLEPMPRPRKRDRARRLGGAIARRLARRLGR